MEIISKLLPNRAISQTQKVILTHKFKAMYAIFEYSLLQCKTENLELVDSCRKYMNLRNEIPNLEIRDQIMYDLKSLKGSKDIAKIFQRIYQNSESVKSVFEENENKEFWKVKKNNLILNLEFYNPYPTHNPLSLINFSAPLGELETKIKEAGMTDTIRIEGWIVNHPAFQRFFPDSMTNSIVTPTRSIIYDQKVWGQLYNYNGTLNPKRFKQFHKNKKLTFEYGISEFPLKDMKKDEYRSSVECYKSLGI